MAFEADIAKAQKKLAELQDEIVDKRVMTSLARLMRSIIYKRTKTGKGVSNGKSIKLAPLTDGTIAARSGEGSFRTITTSGGKRVIYIPGLDERPSPTGEFFSPGRSNLTYSGQMLDSMTFKVFRGLGFTLFIPDSKRQKRPGETTGVTNRDVAIFVQAGRTTPTNSFPRPFFELTNGEIRIILKRYNDIIKSFIRRKGL